MKPKKLVWKVDNETLSAKFGQIYSFAITPFFKDSNGAHDVCFRLIVNGSSENDTSFTKLKDATDKATEICFNFLKEMAED